MTYLEIRFLIYFILGRYVQRITVYPSQHSDVGGPGWSFRLRPRFWADRPSDNNWTHHFVAMATPGIGGAIDIEYVPIMFLEYVMAPYVWPAEKDEGNYIILTYKPLYS